MVSNNAIASIIFGMIFCFVFPIAILIYFKKKEHFKVKPVLMGSLVFIVFALILEQMFHKFVITSKIIPVNTIGFAVYAALAAGVFEETGRFVAFKMFLKKNTEWKDGLGYGIGHGGIEMVLVGGLSYLNSVALALAINSGTLNSLVKGQDSSVVENLKNALISITSQMIAIGTAERVFAFVIQMALTFVVLYGIRKRKNIYLLAAILFHSLIDLPAGLYQVKFISNIFLIEGMLFIFAVIALAFIFKSKKIFNTI